MGAVNCKSSSRHSDAVSPKSTGFRAQRAVQRKQKKSAREVIRAILLSKRRSRNKIVPVTPLGDPSRPDSDTLLATYKVFCQSEDHPSILPVLDVSLSPEPTNQVSDENDQKSQKNSCVDDPSTHPISDHGGAESEEPCVEAAQAVKDSMTSAEHIEVSDSDPAVAGDEEEMYESDSFDSELDVSSSPEPSDQLQEEEEEEDTDEYYYDEEMMQVNPAPDVSLPPEPTNAAYLDYLSDSDDEDDVELDELALFRRERYKARISLNMKKAAEFDAQLKHLMSIQKESFMELKLYEALVISARQPPRDYLREEKLNVAIKKLNRKYTQDAVELYRMAGERAITEARVDHFLMKLKPKMSYASIYQSNSSYYLRPIAEESETDLEEAQ